ncbi:MAG TPA: hypothetical protein VNA13_04765, partial [Xanthomonadales bacterium]|nr:hypothetical protein [Xanthomonadales bacterium]
MSRGFDARAKTRLKKFHSLGYKNIIDLWIIDSYTVDKSFSQNQLEEIASKLSNPITQEYILRTEKIKVKPKKEFAFVIEIGFLPGVTDNVAHTAGEIIEDGLKVKFKETEGVYTSQITFLVGKISKQETESIALSMHNPLIQRSHIKSYAEFVKDG